MDRPTPIPLRADRGALARDYRRSFTRAATAIVLREIQGIAAETVLANWRDDARASLIAKGSVTPTKRGDFPGSILTEYLALSPRAAWAQVAELAHKVDLTGTDQFSFPLPQNFTAAQWVAEGEPISVGVGDFSGMLIGPVKKIALIGTLSSELEFATAGTASTVIDHVIETSVGDGMTGKMLSADAASDSAPAGLLYGIAALPPGTSMAADLSALVSAIAAAGINTSGVVFVCAPGQAITLELAAGVHFAHRIIEANITPGTIIAIAPDALVIAGSGGPRSEVSKQSTLHMSDPAAPVMANAPTRDLFQTSTFALRTIARLTWSAAPGAVQWIEDAVW